MKRFYKMVTTHKTPNGWAVHLDGKPVKAPSRNELLASNDALAQEIAKEWMAQIDTIKPDTMPLTQILSTQIDQVRHQRADMQRSVVKYFDTDLLCYRVDPAISNHTEEQAKRQVALWDCWLEWFAQKFGFELQTTTSLAALTHPPESHKAIQDHVDKLDEAQFTVLQMLVPLTGSLILSMAFIENALSAKDIFDASHIEEHYKDEIYNAEFYGRDPLQDKKEAVTKRDLEAAALFLKLS